MTSLVQALGPIAPHAMSLLEAAKNGASLEELLAHPSVVSLFQHLASKAEAPQQQAVFSKCPDCGFRYETKF